MASKENVYKLISLRRQFLYMHHIPLLTVWEVGVVGPSDFLEEIPAIINDDDLVAFEVAYVVYIASAGSSEV